MALRTLFLTVANLLIPVAILVFATGFFPYKPFMPGLAQYEELGFSEKLGKDWQKPPTPPFDKVVFMVVDALRSDFVYGEESGMSFVQSLIRDGTALPFTAHATSPTITMPRVKAITTGSIPSFVDVILNFAESDTTSTLATQDTWLAQIRAKDFENGKGKLVMYGDDTWLKLFPNVFERADGTSSFFVSDFTEVDNNVTRHVPNELLNSDWNAMIMHYLGLDHIGHKAGPKSPNMVPKQIEMDEIVRDIYSAIENEDHLSDTLFVLCGDHGMNDGGNHGGSSPGETSPALVFMSPKLTKITKPANRKSPVKPKTEGEFEYYRMVEQSDIAPTLASLLGFPVPQNNLGVFLEDFLPFWDAPLDRIQLLYRNAKQMKKIVAVKYTNLKFEDSFVKSGHAPECAEGYDANDGQKLACLWRAIISSLADGKNDVTSFYKFMHLAQETMSSTASNYNLPRLFIGTGLAFLICILSFFTLPSFRPITPAGIYFGLSLALYAILMFASSYVEEEHNFWYWTASGWFFCLFLQNMRKEWYSQWIFHPAIMALAVHRIIRRWNQTGQKYAGADDIVNSGLFHGRYSAILWIFIGVTYMDLTIRLARHVARSVATFDSDQKARTVELESTDQHRLLGTIAVLPLCGTAFVFKLAFTAKDAPEMTSGINADLMAKIDTLELVGLARMVFGGVLLSGVWIAFAEWTRSNRRKARGRQGNGDLAVAFFDLTTLFLLTQTKAENIPLYFLFRLQNLFLSLLTLTPASITLTTLLLSQTSFFALANSNSISSISLSNSYNGISTYNIFAVGLLVFASNWAGPIYWSLAGLLLLGRHGGTQRFVDTREMHVADWVAKEREWLGELAGREQDARDKRGGWEAWVGHVAVLTFWTGAMLAAVMLACMVLRQHLFIWTVFSPKYLFAMAWGVAWHLGVTVGLGGLVWWLGSW
ncbi:hypothetical protein COCSADRAFT_111827 [Bipolaris sorokiniana ND90Pr]|uniref:GPI ethanolamine phosphate transferase 2 n=1 Tax=Cochliobolus sativus (strain ND90Pr / ATCC 201652) TaxID=665912 RepID=M2SKP7_COCSN|nr:uncharacterized protein COCSADRAFT_111827 [Bipolaris sorokiniana ND90Pr]EMD67743.1 hypothetical protein COCSADRAFT_111827 [Bipolaris sorokiniana ND90Pr]